MLEDEALNDGALRKAMVVEVMSLLDDEALKVETLRNAVAEVMSLLEDKTLKI